MSTARTGFAPTRPATPNQRNYIRILMGEIELPTDQITLLHRRFYESAGVPVREPGERIDTALASLTFAQAVSLIETLQRECADQTGDERS